MSTRRTEVEAALASAARELPLTELEVITSLTTRAVKGLHNGYGPVFERLQRVNWEREGSEELVDALFYLTCALYLRMGGLHGKP